MPERPFAYTSIPREAHLPSIEFVSVSLPIPQHMGGEDQVLRYQPASAEPSIVVLDLCNVVLQAVEVIRHRASAGPCDLERTYSLSCSLSLTRVGLPSGPTGSST